MTPARQSASTDSARSIAETLSYFAAGLSYEAVPAAARLSAKLHLLDAIGVAYASASFEFARRTRDSLSAFGPGDYEVIGMSGKLELRDAVLMNGILIHGLDFDDTSIFGRVHPSAFVTPCVLGMAAFVKANGKEALLAYIAGVECAIRIGAAAKGGFQRAGFHPVGVVGAFGAAIAAGRLLRLEPAQLTMAQGIAYSSAAGNNEYTVNDAWTKRMHAGWAGVGGITAAMLARGGFIGPRTPYEGKFGLYRTYLGAGAASCDLVEMTAQLGTRWEIEHVAFKPIASCHFNHPIIDATITLVTEHNLAPGHIKSIRALLPEAAINTVCEPRANKRAPTDPFGAQFSVYYAAACAAARRRYTLADLDPPALSDPEVLALAAKVDYAVDSESNFPRHYSGAVEIVTYDGRRVSRREDVNRGSSERPLTNAAIEEKFLANAQRVIPKTRAEAVRDAILNIDSSADVTSVTREMCLR
ncbi:MAG: MmgE/PrpD family protein [Betaproteobacteria bacterium]|nr:MmgE/PrpD family protein [Betaproteobacteria bacterium]